MTPYIILCVSLTLTITAMVDFKSKLISMKVIQIVQNLMLILKTKNYCLSVLFDILLERSIE